ncbi:N-formylglutamate amidohydrolase [Neoaquamicrobium sediminum]|uniref:N-formylglutamate amidohydrolase n=1 Tax=Neoaquamicrobium sediminum TaxID=1849104 RepID=UPI001567836D|nr:N-formylglutamate amidohydrolase [Mesorhizobium sediminum]NRC57252.1 N-formylglutamate amidohydrolase [Mesorhizobium sediminum]
MSAHAFLRDRTSATVRNKNGASPIALVCEHASNHVPDHLDNLGLPEDKLAEHIAWDPGALSVAEILSDLLDAPLVRANVSRLVLDINREPDHPTSIVTVSETTAIPGNAGISKAERAIRGEAIYKPFHTTLDQLLANRHVASCVVSIHSFTPVYKGVRRPWHVGVLHNEDTQLSAPLIEALRRDRYLVVGDNEPYAPVDGVYHTIERHTVPFGRMGAMIEIRNDLIADYEGQSEWAHRLRRILDEILEP